MAKAKKLPSGNWRCEAYVGREKYRTKDGQIKEKMIKKSFTAKTKKEAEYMASAWLMSNKNAVEGNITLSEAFDKLIDAKRNVWSPSTLSNNQRLCRSAFMEIENTRLSAITTLRVQKWANNYSLNHAPKTVRNAHNFLMTTLKMFDVSIGEIKLPQKRKEKKYVPTDEEVRLLLNECTSPNLKKAMLLAAFGPLRRGEICALTVADIDQDKNMITINKNLVQGPDGWTIKPPKTYAGYRSIVLPEKIIEELLKDADEKKYGGRIVTASPDTITQSFTSLRNKCGLRQVTFHTLRHYSASKMGTMNVDPQTIIARGGWSTTSIMTSIYQHEMSDHAAKMNYIINKKFDEVIYDTI